MQYIKQQKNIMTQDFYNKFKDFDSNFLRSQLIFDIKLKICSVYEDAPASYRPMVAYCCDSGLDKLMEESNYFLFEFFASDDITIEDFIHNLTSYL